MSALAMLTRGLIGVIFPVAIIGLFVMATRGWNRLREMHLISSTLIFLAVAVPWHLLASLRAKTFFWSYFINEHFKRAVGTRFPPDYEAVPLWLWLGAHLIWFFPWSIFLWAAFRKFPAMRDWRSLNAPQPSRSHNRHAMRLWHQPSMHGANRRDMIRATEKIGLRNS